MKTQKLLCENVVLNYTLKLESEGSNTITKTTISMCTKENKCTYFYVLAPNNKAVPNNFN